MSRVTVVGSGPSGVHFARTLLERGIDVHLIDAGREGPAPVEPALSLSGLKDTLEDPVGYFLGDDLYGLTLPGAVGEFYGFPPQKRFVFERPPGLGDSAEGFEPLGSWARGGLARAWTAGVYPFGDAELEAFPFDLDELGPRYGTVASRIGVVGEQDDLSAFMPWHDGIESPLRLDWQSTSLMRRYGRVRDRLRRRGCFLGRSRLAVLSAPRDERGACEYLARCLWGCPVGALYTPELTLAECRRYSGFTYEPGLLAEAFECSEDRRIRALRVRRLDGGAREIRPVDTLALATGTLETARLFLASWHETTGERAALTGLMDNRQVLVPFIHLAGIGRRVEERSYQYHQLSMGLPSARPEEYVHGQITTLTTSQVHPVMETMPLDLRTAGWVFRTVRAGLGLVNLNFHDRRRETCSVALDPAIGGTDGSGEAGPATLRLRYEPPPDEPERIRGTVRRVRRALRALGCVVAPGATHIRPMGASVHYAGTLPMSTNDERFTVTPDCRSREFPNLVIADGSTFPFLPAKNITFSLMANAVRVAEQLVP